MFKWFNKKKKDNKGFTLVELVIVVAILAILVGILAPQYTKYVEKSRKSADASNMENLVRSVEIQAADATDTIPADTYTITINTINTTVTPKTTVNATGKAAVEKALAEFVDVNWKNTKLKSKKWTGSEITATITVDSEGGTTVEYSGKDFKEYMGKAETTTTTTK